MYDAAVFPGLGKATRALCRQLVKVTAYPWLVEAGACCWTGTGQRRRPAGKRAVVALLYSVGTAAALRVRSGVGLGGALQLAPQPVLRDVRDLGKRHALEGTAGSPAVDPVRLAT